MADLAKLIASTDVILVATTGVVTRFTPATGAAADVGVAMQLAKAAAAPGDTIYVYQSADLGSGGLWASGVNWWFANVTITTTGNLFQVTDAVRFRVTGRGKFVCLRLYQASTAITFDFTIECDRVNTSNTFSLTGSSTAGLIRVRANRITSAFNISNTGCTCELSPADPGNLFITTATTTTLSSGKLRLKNCVVDSTAGAVPTFTLTGSILVLENTTVITQAGQASFHTTTTATVVILGSLAYDGTADAGVTLDYKTATPDTPVSVTLTAGEREAIADSQFDRANGIADGFTMRQTLNLLLADIGGKRVDAGLPTESIFDVGDDTQIRIFTNCDAAGNGPPILTPP